MLEGLWLRTRATVYRDLYHFWTKIFAVNFGMGVVSGLVMAYQFGTNWSFFSDFAGSITGPLLAYEVLTAFFLEAGFLGVMLFGWSRVGPGLHFFHGDGGAGHAGVGHLDPGVQQLDADAGRLRDRQRQVVPTDWLAVIFNPSFPIAWRTWASPPSWPRR